MATASSINIKKNSSSLKHNDRSGREPKYLLPLKFRKENEFDRTADEAQKLLDEYIFEAKSNYTKITGQKFQAKVLKFEAVVNLNENHTMEDMKKLNLAIEKEFGFRAVQTAIHRDEGHIDKDTNQPIYNYHCHIVFCNLDKNGKTLLKQLNRSGLRKLQDLTANVLNMKRGKSAEITKAKHKSHQQFKKEKIEEKLIQAVKKEKEMKQELAKAKDLQEINKQLREDLKQAAATREDYAKLEQLNKDLKEQVKSKTLTIEELEKRIDEYKQNKAPRTNENDLNDKSIHYRELEQNIAFKSDLDKNLSSHISEKELNIKTGVLGSEKQNLNIVDSPYNLRTSILSTFTKSIIDLYEIAKTKAKKFYEDIIKEKDKEIKELKEKVKDLQTTIYGKDKTIQKLKEITTPELEKKNQIQKGRF